MQSTQLVTKALSKGRPVFLQHCGRGSSSLSKVLLPTDARVNFLEPSKEWPGHLTRRQRQQGLRAVQGLRCTAHPSRPSSPFPRFVSVGYDVGWTPQSQRAPQRPHSAAAATLDLSLSRPIVRSLELFTPPADKCFTQPAVSGNWTSSTSSCSMTEILSCGHEVTSYLFNENRC
jgi:hypothetical protein